VDLDIVEMYTFELRECGGLDETSNFIPHKLRIQIFMVEAKIWENVEKDIAALIDPKLLAAHRKEAKVKRIILHSMKDHFITHIVDKETSKEMLESLIGLF